MSVFDCNLRSSQASLLQFFFFSARVISSLRHQFCVAGYYLAPNRHFTLVFYSTPYAKVLELYLFRKPDLPFIHVPLVALHHLASPWAFLCDFVVSHEMF